MGVFLLDPYIRQLSLNTGIPYIQLHFVFSIISAYPFAFLFRYIKGTRLRILSSLVFGLILQYQMIGWNLYHMVIETLITYFFIRFFGRKVSAFYLIAINFIHLTSLHIYDYIYYHNEWTLGAETVCMMSVCKFSIVAFNYEDGGKPDSDILNDFFRKKKLVERPHLLEIFSYNFFFPTCLIGPSIEFHDFREFMRLEGDYKSLDYNKCNHQLIYDVTKSVIVVGMTSVLSGPLSLDYNGSDEYMTKSLLYKIIYVFLSVITLRTKYYSGWSLAETALTMCGFSFVAKQENDKKVITFDRVDNCNIKKIECSISNGIKMQYWNRGVHLWLKNYVYIRLQKPDRSNRGFVSFVTFIISAFWHGVYPNYYIFFMFMYLNEQICNYINAWGVFEWIDNDKNMIRKGCFYFLFFWFMDFCGVAFTLSSLLKLWNFYKSFYFIPNLVLILGYVYVNWIGRRPSRKKKL